MMMMMMMMAFMRAQLQLRGKYKLYNIYLLYNILYRLVKCKALWGRAWHACICTYAHVTFGLGVRVD